MQCHIYRIINVWQKVFVAVDKKTSDDPAMIKVSRHRIFSACVVFCLGSGLAEAQDRGVPLNLSIKSRLGSGLELNLASRLLEFDVHYKLQSVLKETAAVADSALSQLFTARLQSALLNEVH